MLKEAFVRPIGESQRLIGLGTMTQVFLENISCKKLENFKNNKA